MMGTIEITTMGSLVARIDRSWPVLWRTQTTVIVGFRGSVEMTLVDIIGQQQYELRYKAKTKCFTVPAILINGTCQYDVPANRTDGRVLKREIGELMPGIRKRLEELKV